MVTNIRGVFGNDLAQNKIDKARAEQSAKIGKKYLLALAEQIDENEDEE